MDWPRVGHHTAGYRTASWQPGCNQHSRKRQYIYIDAQAMEVGQIRNLQIERGTYFMEKKKMRALLSLLLVMVFITACSLPGNETPTPTVPLTEESQATATELPVTPQGDETPVTGAGLCANAY